MSGNSNHYVDNQKLLQALTVYRAEFLQAKENNQQRPKVPEYVGRCIMEIAEGFSNYWKFHKYPFKDEMIGDGIENCVAYIHNFNPEKSNNPFSYITKIVMFAFIRRITKEKKYLYTKQKAYQNDYVLRKLLEQPNSDVDVEQFGVDTDYMNEFMAAFEESAAVKREKKGKKVKKVQNS